MLPDIRSKLGSCVDQSDYTQRDVVYVLVQAYKLLENVGDKENFPAITFYRNWACHAFLEGYRAPFHSTIERYKNGYGSMDGVDKASEEIRAAFKSLSPSVLRSELDSLLETYLEPHVGPYKLAWPAFRMQLYGVIQDIPIRVREGGAEVFRLECRAIEYKHEYDDLRLGAELGNSSFEFHVQDSTL